MVSVLDWAAVRATRKQGQLMTTDLVLVLARSATAGVLAATQRDGKHRRATRKVGRGDETAGVSAKRPPTRHDRCRRRPAMSTNANEVAETLAELGAETIVTHRVRNRQPRRSTHAQTRLLHCRTTRRAADRRGRGRPWANSRARTGRPGAGRGRSLCRQGNRNAREGRRTRAIVRRRVASRSSSVAPSVRRQLSGRCRRGCCSCAC
jgi:hypothetical protein